MLRRNQPIVFSDENEPAPPPRSEPRLQSVPNPPPEPEPRPASEPFIERRKTDRRGMDALRSEALRTIISQVEDRNFGGLRQRMTWPSRLKPSRLALVLVAIVAGGLAAYLVVQHDPVATPTIAEPVVEVVVAPTAQVLVARSDLRIGERLTEASMGWEEWPLSAVHQQYITSDMVPDALTEMSGSVARSAFLTGEPIRAEKLVEATGGYLSAVLGGGQRGVSVVVSAEAASGGFVTPGDHVDILLTRAGEVGQDSRTVLHNVRVLAINARLGEEGAPGEGAESEIFTGSAIATLGLDPKQAEVITAASTMGQLSLVLRSSADITEPLPAEQRASNQFIRLTSPFWQ